MSEVIEAKAAISPQEQFQIERQKYIGGSDIAAILGLSPWRNAVDLWLDKTTPRREGDGNNAVAKRRGSRLEPYIIDMICEDYGLEIVERNHRYLDDEYPFLAAEIDFEYQDPETGQVENGEIKTVHPFKKKEWGEVETDSLPLYYLTQVHHGMGVRHARRCRVFALIGDELRPYVVERDDELIASMRARAVDFWTRYVVPQVQPPLNFDDGEDAIETLKRLYPGTDGTVLSANPMQDHWRAVIKTAAEMQRHYENVVAAGKAHLLSEMGMATALQFDDGQAFIRKEIKKKAYTVEFPASRYIDTRFGKLKEK